MTKLVLPCDRCGNGFSSQIITALCMPCAVGSARAELGRECPRPITGAELLAAAQSARNHQPVNA